MQAVVRNALLVSAFALASLCVPRARLLLRRAPGSGGGGGGGGANASFVPVVVDALARGALTCVHDFDPLPAAAGLRAARGAGADTDWDWDENGEGDWDADEGDEDVYGRYSDDEGVYGRYSDDEDEYEDDDDEDDGSESAAMDEERDVVDRDWPDFLANEDAAGGAARALLHEAGEVGEVGAHVGDDGAAQAHEREPRGLTYFEFEEGFGNETHIYRGDDADESDSDSDDGEDER